MFHIVDSRKSLDCVGETGKAQEPPASCLGLFSPMV